jgi:diguanylate cyclase (GGDEF)-like protein
MVGNIMIVDDSLIDRKMIRKILEKNIQDIQVFEIQTGHLIIQQLINHNIKVCILNVRMPDWDGLEILDEIMSCSSTMNIPVIVIGTRDIHNIERALKSGALDYITKPLTEEVMKIALPLKVKNAIALINRTQTIHYLSYHDTLTGLYNRRFFEVELDRLDTQRQLPISLIIGDVNGLKLVNDLFGHQQGDKTLIAIGNILKQVCRKEDIISRWGGDEFIILLPNTAGATAEEICQRINNKCEEYDSLPMKLSISLGMASKIHMDEPISELIIRADKRMYQNKFEENKPSHVETLQKIINSIKTSEIEKGLIDGFQLDSREYNHLLKIIKTSMDEKIEITAG